MMFIFWYISIVISLSFWIFVFLPLNRWKESDNVIDPETSIIVAFYNEGDHLPRLLPQLLNQSVKEILLIDDFSTDNSLSNISQYKDSRIRVIQNKYKKGKKGAIKTGIECANYPCILFTDADCNIASNDWATLMVSSDRPIVLGYGPMRKTKGWIATFSRYETWITGMLYLGLANLGLPYMGVGRNMKINKQLLIDNQQIIKGNHLKSGDDDLTINALANGQNTAIDLRPETYIYSQPKANLKDFIKQKSRHVSTASHYKWYHQVLLMLFSGSHMATYIIALFLLWIEAANGVFILEIFALKWFVQIISSHKISRLMLEKDLCLKIPLLDILMCFYYIILSPYLIFKNKHSWK